MFGHEYTITADEIAQEAGIVSSATDGERDYAERVADRVTGDGAEVAFRKFLIDTLGEDGDWEHVDDVSGTHEYDFIVQGAKVDVKGRDMDGDRQDPDILGRIHEDAEPRIHAHIYIQVRMFSGLMGNKWTGVIHGFCTEEQMAEAREFDRKRGDAYKPCVSAGQIQDIDELADGIDEALEAFETRGGHVCMLDTMLNSQHNTLDLAKVEANHSDDCVCLV
jgi:hypothetical protein